MTITSADIQTLDQADPLYMLVEMKVDGVIIRLCNARGGITHNGNEFNATSFDTNIVGSLPCFHIDGWLLGAAYVDAVIYVKHLTEVVQIYEGRIRVSA